MKRKVSRQESNGQSMVEFALVLPFLLLLFLGMIEVGYAMYDYIVLSNANREGVRLAARGRFTDEAIIERIIAGGGFREDEDKTMVPILSTDENFGVIITHIPFLKDSGANWQANQVTVACCQPECPDPQEGKINITVCAKYVVVDNGEIRTITGADSRFADLDEYNDDVDISSIINEMREDGGLVEMANEIVMVETFLAHPMLLHLPDFLPIPDPLPLYFRSSMRVSK